MGLVADVAVHRLLLVKLILVLLVVNRLEGAVDVHPGLPPYNMNVETQEVVLLQILLNLNKILLLFLDLQQVLGSPGA